MGQLFLQQEGSHIWGMQPASRILQIGQLALDAREWGYSWVFYVGSLDALLVLGQWFSTFLIFVLS